MTPEPLSPQEVEARLRELHRDSFGWAMSCCAWEESDAEDVLQTVYLKVISGRARYGGRSSFRTWLFGVIRRTAHEHRRRAKSERERAERLAREVAARGGAVVEPPDGAVERRLRSKELLEALDGLPQRQREVLHLVFYQDLTIREAADVMEVSVGAARVHYDRGKKKLRALLSAQEIGERRP